MVSLSRVLCVAVIRFRWSFVCSLGLRFLISGVVFIIEKSVLY